MLWRIGLCKHSLVTCEGHVNKTNSCADPDEVIDTLEMMARAFPTSRQWNETSYVDDNSS